MASFSAGTTFTDGVANDVTAAKLGALVNNATPTSGLIQDRTAETVTATNDTLLIGDASDSNNLKRITVANFAQTLPTAKITTGTIETGTFGTTTSTAATITLVTTGTGTAASPAIVTTGDTNTGIFFPAADTIAFSEGGTESVRIDSSGNVGIGTTSPTDAKLSVYANNLTIPAIAARYSAAGYKMGFGVYNVFGYPYLGLNCNQVTSSNNQTYDLSAHATKLDMSIDGSTPGFVFSTAASGTAGNAITWSERLRIDSSGNVGIGVTNPLVKLHINGITRIGSGNDYQFDSTLKINAESTGATGYLRFYTDSTERLRIDSSGNVGIGTTTAHKTLTVGSNDATAYISAGGNNVNLTIASIGSAGSVIFKTGGTNGDATTTTERLRIDSSGNVGIGLTNPSASLSILSNSNALGIRINGRSSDNVSDLSFYANDNSTQYANIQGRSTDLRIGTPSAIPITFYTNSTERIRIDSSGNVGIGTTGAVNKLEIVGSFGRGAPVTKTGDFTLADTENWIIVNKGSTCTVTLPAASSWTGREFTIKVITAHTVVSASSNVVPRNSATAGTAILTNAAGAWATLVSNGTNWVIMCGS